MIVPMHMILGEYKGSEEYEDTNGCGGGLIEEWM
jgi:hypothetical protein